MAWYLWMIAGAAGAALALFLYVCILDAIDTKSMERQRQVRSQQSAAEQDMQKIVQNTIAQMFNATRGPFR